MLFVGFVGIVLRGSGWRGAVGLSSLSTVTEHIGVGPVGSGGEKASVMLQELACVDNREEFGLWRKSTGRDSLHDLVHAAVLAANAQNAQRWRYI